MKGTRGFQQQFRVHVRTDNLQYKRNGKTFPNQRVHQTKNGFHRFPVADEFVERFFAGREIVAIDNELQNLTGVIGIRVDIQCDLFGGTIVEKLRQVFGKFDEINLKGIQVGEIGKSAGRFGQCGLLEQTEAVGDLHGPQVGVRDEKLEIVIGEPAAVDDRQALQVPEKFLFVPEASETKHVIS